MAQSHAERQRRYRERKRAEQAKQPPAETKPVTPPVTGDTPADPSQPRYLRSRGRRLWAELTTDDEPDPTEVVLIEEACRIVDRLDKLDAILGARDKAWITLQVPEDGSVAEIVVDKALSEARQQQIALKQLLSELRTARSGRQALARLSQPPKPAATSGGAGVPAGVGDLTARIAERRAQTAG